MTSRPLSMAQPSAELEATGSPGPVRHGIWPSAISPRVTTNLMERLAGLNAWVAVTAFSAMLGLVADRSSVLSTLHFLLTFVALAAAALLARRPEPVLAITVYAGTADVFWRSTSARGPWEASKYALIIGFAVIAVRFMKRPRNLRLTASLVLLLVPGAVFGVAKLGVVTSRELLAANLGGLVALAVGTLVCSNLRLSLSEVRGLYLAALSPILSMAAVATAATSSVREFGTQSNFAAAGGFGPVQVSAVLCFGGILCVLVLLQRAAAWRVRVFALFLAVWLVGQALLTFSRGGVFSFAIAAACITLAGLTASGHRARTVVVAGLLLVTGLQVLSWVGAFTDGASEARFSSTDTTNRGDLARADLDLFWKDPLAGVGAGASVYERDYPVRSMPHTEYSRLLAEHGLLGLAVLGVLGWLAVRMVRGNRGWWQMASVGLLAMSLVQMTHSATRIGCIALGFALGALREEAS